MSKTSTFPTYILRAPMSQIARLLFIELALELSQKCPNVLIDYEKLASNLGKRVSTIKRALRELIKLGF